MHQINRINRPFALVILLGVLACSPMLHRCIACTTVVVSGKATVDGRPLLWKNRDTWQRQNELLYDDGGRYPFVGVANAEATERIRMGVNTVGLCIENSVSRDLAPTVESGPSNGELIKLALRTCSTAAEFQDLLDRTNRIGRQTRGNFGVIDAGGAAMMFEVGPNSFTAFDANDPADAPNGYIVRANFSETAQSAEAQQLVSRESTYSIERFTRADQLCSLRTKTQPIDFRFLLQAVARDADGCSASQFATPITRSRVACPDDFSTSKTLNRNNTVSAVVFHGVLPGESPILTTMWTLLGEPMFSVAVPSWAAQGGVAEATNGDGTSQLCRLAIELRNRHYDESGRRLLTKDLEATTKQLTRTENNLITQINQKVAQWRNAAPTPQALRRSHEMAAMRATETLKRLSKKQSASVSIAALVQPVSIDFRFDDAEGTKLESSKNAAGDTAWDGGLVDCSVRDGVFRIRRNKSSATNRYASIAPPVRVRGDKITHRGYLVAEVKRWNLRGKTLGEEVRFGFTSQSENNYQSAAMLLKRTGDDEVTLSGIAFGEGSTPINATHSFPALQTTPVTFVLEFDKVKGNPDEGERGGEYRVYYRREGERTFTPLGPAGMTRRNRNGNEIHFRCAGLFAAQDERFDIDRIYYTTTSPVR